MKSSSDGNHGILNRQISHSSHRQRSNVHLSSLRVRQLELQRDEKSVNACVAFAALQPDKIDDAADQWLHINEKSQLEEMKFDQRRMSFTSGRVAAKAALIALTGKGFAQGFYLDAGVFGQPLVQGLEEHVQVSISHCNQWGAAVAFWEGHPMGIDLELPSEDKNEVMLAQYTANEIALIEASNLPKDRACTLAWSVKESLSKVLRTGLMCPLNVYEIESLSYEEGYGTAIFVNFAQYRSVSFQFGSMQCAVTLPKRTVWLTPHEAFTSSPDSYEKFD